MKHIPIRLGPLALLLTVISICMTTLGILSFTTARADLKMAEKYAATVEERYLLEKEGQTFLSEIGGALAEGVEPEGLEGLFGTEADEEGIFHKKLEYGDSWLSVGFVAVGEGGFRIVEWRIQKDWEPDDGMGGLWDGTF